MGEPRLEALAVLRGEADAAALRPAHHQRHARLAAQHEAEFRRLIDQHVHGQRHEIENLDLHDGAHAGDGGADAAADEGGFRDRRVAHALFSEALDQPFRHLEDAAGQADILAHEEHAVVALHFAVDRFVQRFDEGDFAVGARSGLHRLRVRRIDRLPHDLDRRFGASLPERHGVFEFAVYFVADFLHALAGHGAGVADGLFHDDDGVARLPLLELVLGARVAEIGAHRVLAPAIGHRFDQRRPLARPRALDRLHDGEIDLGGVVAVDGDAGDVVCGRAQRHVFHRRGLPVRGGQRVLVVLANEHHRQFPHRRQVERLVEDALVVGAVAEESDGDLPLAAQARGQPGADRQRHGGADDAVGAEYVQVHVGDMHRAAEAAAIARLAAHQLGHHAVDAGRPWRCSGRGRDGSSRYSPFRTAPRTRRRRWPPRPCSCGRCP